jgi:ATP synthase F0 subunit b
MQIDWWTLALQGINFLLLVWLLERFLYRPVKEVVAKRKALAQQAFTEAEAAKAEAEAAGRKFDEDRAQLARDRQASLKQLHDDIEAERGKIIEQAKAEADKILKEARAAIAEERAATLSELREEVAALAADMASTLLRKSGSEGLNDTFLRQIEEKLKSLSDDEREGLKSDLAANGANLTVVTAATLAPEDQERWRERIGGLLDRPKDTSFVADPAIIGGAELRFPHAVVKFTWADQLEEAKRELCRDAPPS